MATMQEELSHLKNHVSYPATRSQVVSACNNMAHIEAGNKDWISKNLPEGTYKGPGEVLSALLTKV